MIKTRLFLALAACAALLASPLAAFASDLSVTAASVVAGSNAITTTGTAGETIAAGKAVYQSSTTKKWMLADSNSATAEVRLARGVALTSSSLNQPISVQRSGEVTIGATLVANTAYYLSDTPGGICPLADVGTGEYMVLLGIAKSTSVLVMNITATLVAN